MKYLLHFSLFPCLLAFCGCGYQALSPWMEEATVVPDDRLAGIWQGDCLLYAKEDAADDDLVIVTVQGKIDGIVAPEGMYNITWYAGDNLNEGIQQAIGPFPYKLGATLHQVDDVMILQLRGDIPCTEYFFPLSAPLFMVYRLELDEDQIRLYDMVIDKEDDKAVLSGAGLAFKDMGEGRCILFSDTSDLDAFLGMHAGDPGFFSEEPSVILRRIQDLRSAGPEPDEEDWAGVGAEQP